jgi:cyanate permease
LAEDVLVLLVQAATGDGVDLDGALAAASAVLLIVLARERPPTPPCPSGQEVRAQMLDGLKHALKVSTFLLYLVVWLIGMGIFNRVTTWIEVIVWPQGFSPADAGTLGALMLAGGLLGTVVIPSLSDRQRKRQRYLALGFGLVQLCGRASAVFVYIMGALQTADGSLTPSLIPAIGQMLISLVLTSQMRDPEPVFLSISSG